MFTRSYDMTMEAFKEAVAYDNNSSGQREDGQTLMKHLSLETGSKILDLGCGAGYLTKILAEIIGPDGKASIIIMEGKKQNMWPRKLV